MTYGTVSYARTATPCHTPCAHAAARGRIGLPAALWCVRRRQAVERANRYALEELPHGGLELA